MNINSVKKSYIPKVMVRLVKESNLITTAPKIIRQPEDAAKILHEVFDGLTVEYFVAMCGVPHSVDR